MVWVSQSGIPPRSYDCGFCDNRVGVNIGFQQHGGGGNRIIYLCPHCDRPTFFDDANLATVKQYPSPAPGDSVGHLPSDVDELYQEARNCLSVNANTATVLVCRKILMNAAVSLGATEGKSFVQYVDWLVKEGHVPPKGRAWVDHIRKQGNLANHEIQAIPRTVAEEMLTFVGMLLKMVHEFPGRLPAP